jgi:hypothetical protein
MSNINETFLLSVGWETSKECLRFSDRSVSIPKTYELDGRGSIPCRSKRFFSYPQCPYRLWGRVSPGSFPKGKSAGA